VKVGNSGELGEEHPSGAEARADFAGLMRGLKPPPPSGSSFSAACKATRITNLRSGGWRLRLPPTHGRGGDFWLAFGRLEAPAPSDGRARWKKSAIQVNSAKGIPPGLKPARILLALCGG